MPNLSLKTERQDDAVFLLDNEWKVVGAAARYDVKSLTEKAREIAKARGCDTFSIDGHIEVTQPSRPLPFVARQ